MNDNLIIYGSGDVTSLKLYAESLGIGERVHLPGQISDVPTFIKSARLFVLSSNVEGMPNALMDYGYWSTLYINRLPLWRSSNAISRKH